MLRDLLNHPPATHSVRPERRDERPGPVEEAFKILTGGVERKIRSGMADLERIVALVDSHSDEMAGKSDVELRNEAQGLGIDLRRHGFSGDLVAGVFALIREASSRVAGKRHFAVQLMGGWALLRGMVAEMETGEGKTLTATLAAGAAALGGVPVHVLTVNDYLTARDAEEMGPIYRALGLTVGCVTHDVPVGMRREQYLRNIVYCTNKEIVFDYLRDKLTLSERAGATLRIQAESLYRQETRSAKLLLRGLCYAITDEADSLLIDESRTPLIIAGSVAGADEIGYFRAVLEFAGSLREGSDFAVDRASRSIRVTREGQRRIDAAALSAESRWSGTIRNNEMVRRALSALHLHHRDREYLVREDKVEIIDIYTGRVMPDRSWEQGLHQLVEIKEGCKVTQQNETLAKISYQKFFRRYLHLAGMTGTAWEVAGELWAIYGLPVVRIRTNRPCRRICRPAAILPTKEEKWQYLLRRVRAIHATGRPLLVGTASVAASEDVSRLFSAAGLSHRVLNAKKDREEAEIVARAGEPGVITIATNMAGRGTDIKLAPGVAELKGLHVIMTERHDAARIDRQLAGRCARQGDPGSFEPILSLEDQILSGGKGGAYGLVARRFLPAGSRLWGFMAERAIGRAQRKMEQLHFRMRQQLYKQDVKSKGRMSFSRREA